MDFDIVPDHVDPSLGDMAAALCLVQAKQENILRSLIFRAR